MSAVELFTYAEDDLRAVVIDGEPWFVAGDVARMLGYRDAHNMARRLDDDEKGTRSLSTPGGQQVVGIINESGLYTAILGSQIEGAQRFKRWVTREVLPAIRRTGSYGTRPALTGAELLAHAVLEAQAMLAAKDERIAELEPKAEVADRFLTAEGDLSVRDAAQSLTRAGIQVGERRLFSCLEKRQKWIGRAGDGRYRVYQSAIDAGYMSVLPQSHYHPRTGVLVIDPPQPRVTPKGLQRLLSAYNHGAA
ncbi:BRO family protein [Mycobacterium sp. pUA109]|uniref:BRO family protein n=1 Tax=Mycobacterium sp. pUA109 TaxID=3238982 RepID=UPI00351BE976